MRIIIGLLLITFLPLMAQDPAYYKYTDLNAARAEYRGSDPEKAPSLIARISFIAPMFVLEFAPTQEFVFSTGIRIWPTFWEKNEQGSNVYNPSLNPHMTLEPRFFFSQANRMVKGRRTDFHSGWYIGFPFEMSFPELDFSMGTVMGFQCTFGKRWYWNVGLGPGVYFQDSNFRMGAAGTAAFGVILN